MNTVKIDNNFFGNYNSEKELFEKVKEWVKINLTGKKIFISEIEINVELTWQGLKNDLNEFHPPYDLKLISFCKLDEMIKNSKLIYKEKDKNNKKDVKNIYRFFSKINIKNTDYDVIIIIKETSKTFLYDHILLKK